MKTMNNRPNMANVGKGDLKSSPSAKSFKTEVASPTANQSDTVQRDKGTRFSTERAGDSETQQSQTKKAEVDKNVKADTDNAVAEPTVESQEKKFTGRCRLFVGNLPNDMSENEFQKFFEPFGELNEVFLNASRGFGFIRLVSILLNGYR